MLMICALILEESISNHCSVVDHAIEIHPDFPQSFQLNVEKDFLISHDRLILYSDQLTIYDCLPISFSVT